MRRVSVLLLFIVLAAATPKSIPARAVTVDITIESLVFGEVKRPLHTGDTVVWINKDVIAHTATARNGDWRVVIPANAKAMLVLKKGGTVDYYCEYHPNMTGRLVIAAEARRTPPSVGDAAG